MAVGKRKDGRFYPKSVGDSSKGISKKMFEELRAQDARRYATARAVDNKIKAPIDHEGTRWHKQPNRFDVRGIDNPRPKKTPLDELDNAFRKSKYFKLVE